MLAIKPGLCNIWLSRYTKQHVRDYLLNVKRRDVHAPIKDKRKYTIEKDKECSNSLQADKVRPFQLLDDSDTSNNQGRSM